MQISPVSYGNSMSFDGKAQMTLGSNRNVLAEVIKCSGDGNKIGHLSITISDDSKELHKFSQDWQKGIDNCNFIAYVMSNLWMLCTQLQISDGQEQRQISSLVMKALDYEMPNVFKKNLHVSSIHDFPDGYPQDAECYFNPLCF